MIETKRIATPRRTTRRPASPPPAAAAVQHRASVVVKAKPLQTVFGRTEPTRREISERAYYIYLARGGVNGDPVSDWLQAERELREELRAAPRDRSF